MRAADRRLGPLEGEGVPLSGANRSETVPRQVPCARAISGAFSGGLQGDAARPLRDRSSADPATHDRAMTSWIIPVCVTLER